MPGVEVHLRERLKSGDTCAARLQGDVSICFVFIYLNVNIRMHDLQLIVHASSYSYIFLVYVLANRPLDFVVVNQLPVGTVVRSSSLYK